MMLAKMSLPPLSAGVGTTKCRTVIDAKEVTVRALDFVAFRAC